MTLAQRQSDISQAIADLKATIANCDTDLLTAVEPDASAIAKIREEAMGALGALGFASGEPT
jgi:hypothetical protein